jgi:hypothetical protein
MFSCKLLSTAAAFAFHMMRWKSPIASHARTLWYEEKPNDKLGSWISAKYFSKFKVKASIIFLNSDEYTITRKEFFVPLSKNLAWT